MEDFAINLPAYPNLSAYGRQLYNPDGQNWPRIYAYSFCEILSSVEIPCAVSFLEDDVNLGSFAYVVNEKAILPPFNSDLVDACIENFEMKFQTTPIFASYFGQKTGADKYLVIFDPNTIFTATEYRDWNTGLRQVLYSVESNAGATLTMLNAIRYEESAFNVWNPPVINPNLVAVFGAPVAIAIQNHFTTNFDL